MSTKGIFKSAIWRAWLFGAGIFRGGGLTSSTVVERYELIGTSTARITLAGTDTARLSLVGTDSKRITLEGTR
jgi:hypothetical protein